VELSKCDNVGRDLLPFFGLIEDGLLDKYENVLKIHTKRSPWLSGFELPIKSVLGKEWFVRSVCSLIGSKDRFNEIQSLLLSFSDGIAMVGPYGSCLRLDTFMGDNCEDFQLLASIDQQFVELLPKHKFAAGSMYWINSLGIKSMKSINYSSLSYINEPISNDGMSVHALERAIGFLFSKECRLFETEYFLEASTKLEFS
jgi:lipopolysaccharide biosynthesis protein